MRKRWLVLVMAVMMVLVSAAPVMAAPVKRPQPTTPLGIDRSQVDRPEQAEDPITGAVTRIYHGCYQADSCP